MSKRNYASFKFKGRMVKGRKSCAGCKYWQPLSPSVPYQHFCAYLCVTEQPRGCSPKNCTKYVKGNEEKKERVEITYSPKSMLRHEFYLIAEKILSMHCEHNEEEKEVEKID